MGFEQFIKEIQGYVDNTIKIDKRETVESKEMLNLLENQVEEYENRDFEVEEKTLDVGDYAFRNIGIERKESDFIQIQDVLTKAEELKRAYDHAYILISTDFMMLQEAHKEREQVKSLHGLTASLVAREVYPIFCSSRMDMVKIMLKIFDKVTDEKDRTIYQPIRPEPTTDDWKKHIIMGLPQVGEIKAENILEEFDTVREVMTASKQELEAVEGIGPKIAEDILEVIAER